MVLRGRGKGKRMYRRRRFIPIAFRRRRMAVRRLGVRLNVHHFKRTFIGSDTLTISNAGGVTKGLYFAFQSLPNYTELTSLFDQYRINKIVLKYVPNFTGTDLNPSTSVVTLPNLHSVIDYDDANAPANLNELVQYSTYRMTRGNRVHIRKWTPAVSMDIGGVQSSGVKFKQWIDLADTNVPHYGIKLYLDQGSANVGTFIPYWTVYFSCKATR